MATTLTEKVRFYEAVFGPGRMARNCRNFDVRCPICAPKDPTKKKLSILVEDDRCHCWVCGYKSRTLAPLVRKYGSSQQLAEYRNTLMPASVGGGRCVQLWLPDDLSERPTLQLPDDFQMLATSSSRDPDVTAIRSYLVSRNVSEDDVWYYKVGYSRAPCWRRRVIVPSFDAAGSVNHFVGRAIDRWRRPKYDSPEGDRRDVIFNEINVDWGVRVTLCEGTFDMMKCGENAVPLLGSDMNEQSALFNQIVAHGTPVAVALDADMRSTKALRVATKLLEYNVDVLMVDVATDPGAGSKEDFQEALHEARPFDWGLSFTRRLDRASTVRL